MRAPLEPKPLPTKKPKSGSGHGEAILIGILLPVLLAAAWFGYAVFDRTLHPRTLASQDDTPSVIDNVAGFFGHKPTVAVAEPVPVTTAGTGPAIEPPIKPTGPAVAVTPTVKEELPALAPRPYPFDSISRRDPKCLATLLADAKARVYDGKWESHYDRLRYGLYPALTATSATDEARRYDELWENRYFALGMTQAEFVRQVTPAALRQFMTDEQVQPFLIALLADAERMELFLANLKPEDNLGNALRVWARLANDDATELKNKYVNLQVATALVFDQRFSFSRARDPKHERFTVDALERYRYFRDNAERQRLETDLKKLAPYELVWVVSAESTTAEMEWALKENDLKRLKLVTADQKNDWSEAYPMINYRMDFVTGSRPPKAPPGKPAYKPLAESFTRGTLEEIYDVGGICMDQSHFGTTTARAYGIPAASVGGDGNRGGHAWFAYLMPNHQWNMGNGFRPFNEPRNLPGTGRYADGYANGHTRDPQTGRGIGEFEVQLTGDPKRRMKSHYEKAFRLRLAARVYAANTDQEGRYACLRFATHAAELSIDTWKEAAACLEDLGTKADHERWRSFLRDMRVAFNVSDEDKRWPDMLAIADGYAEKQVWTDPKMTPEQIFKECRQSYEVFMREKKRLRGDTMDKTRYDLIVVAAERTARQLVKDTTPKGQENLFFYLRHALQDNREHLPTFRGLLDNFYAAVKGNKKLERFFLEEMRRIYVREMEDTGNDVFRMKTVLGLIDVMLPYFGKCDEPELGRKLVHDKEKIQKELEKLKKQ